jgi:prophage tail gpP-like protein
MTDALGPQPVTTREDLPPLMPAQPLPAPATTRGAPEGLTLHVGGEIHDEWTGASVTRGLAQLASVFHLSAGTIPGESPLKRFPAFASVELRLGGELVLTGWTERPAVEMEGAAEHVTVTGRSKTCDLVDCMPELRGTEFRASKLDAIARAICAPFGLDVVVAADLGAALPLTAMDRTQTAFDFLNHLARMRGVLLTDDELGRLVLARTGTERQAGTLELGRNIHRFSLENDVTKRFSRYVVLSQTGGASVYSNVDPEAEPPGGGAQPNINAVALDSRVPRYRPFILQAEEAGTAAEAQARADWQRSHAAGRSLTVKATIPGTWRDADGALFRSNRLQRVVAERYGLDEELLIVGVTYGLDRAGRRTDLTLSVPEGYTPQPVKPEGGKGGASVFSNVDPANLNGGAR